MNPAWVSNLRDAWFIDDVPRAASLIQARLLPESDTMERLLLLETIAVLAERLPAAVDAAVAWFDTLAADPDLGSEVRLAVLAQRTRYASAQIGPHVIPRRSHSSGSPRFGPSSTLRRAR